MKKRKKPVPWTPPAMTTEGVKLPKRKPKTHTNPHRTHRACAEEPKIPVNLPAAQWALSGMMAMAEAQASVSLDGSTQHCQACSQQRDDPPHRCGRREMTQAERELVEQILFMDRSGYVWNYTPIESAIKAALAARKNGKRRSHANPR